MSEVLFDEEFFKKLKEKIDEYLGFFSRNWIWGIVFIGVLAVLIFLQQVLLSFIK